SGMETKNQTVLVTGMARGIGRAICDRLISDGYAVVGIDVLPVKHDGLAAIEQVNMCDPDAMRMALERLTRRFEITRLVNNVGSSLREYVRDGTGETESTLVRLNLGSALSCLQAVLPAMRRANEGRVVN